MELNMTTINRTAIILETNFDLCGTREKRILSCSLNYGSFNLKVFLYYYCAAAAQSPLLYYLCVSLLAALFS